VLAAGKRCKVTVLHTHIASDWQLRYVAATGGKNGGGGDMNSHCFDIIDTADLKRTHPWGRNFNRHESIFPFKCPSYKGESF
jgi:hypothetical protein